MMSQKQHCLHELLKEDQEPFLLNNYITDRRSQMKRPSPKTSLQAKKRKPMFNQNSNFPVNLCRKTCLFSFPETNTTPDLLRKSPLFEPRSPCKSPNAIFLHIPSRTAALLLEAALRIQKQSSSTSKPKTRGFGLFGSLFKRLTQRNQNRKCDSRRKLCNGTEEKVGSQKDNNLVSVNASEVGFLCSYNGRPSSAVWSESNEDKSPDMETSISGHSDDEDDSEGIHFVTDNQQKCDFCSHHRSFCESPFRFALQTSSSPSSGRHTPELLSPSRHVIEDKESNGGGESLKEFKSGEEDEEEDKEQCSPVSVLDPPFEDDDEGHGINDENDDDDDDDDFDDLESSYAIVQRAKQQLLYKLCRFEKLAGLDPVELEKRMLEQEEDEDETLMEEGGHEDGDREACYEENDFRDLVLQALCQSRVHDRQQIPQELRKLVFDLIVEEERELDSLEDRDVVVRKICKRLELWKEVESNTIDMMIEEDFFREDVVWKKNVEQIRMMAGEVELSIFGFLVEEFSEELIC